MAGSQLRTKIWVIEVKDDTVRDHPVAAVESSILNGPYGVEVVLSACRSVLLQKRREGRNLWTLASEETNILCGFSGTSTVLYAAVI